MLASAIELPAVTDRNLRGKAVRMVNKIKSLLKAPKISENRLSPRFCDTIKISSKEQTELIRHITANGNSYLVRSIFKATAKSPLENMASWINIDLKNNF